MASDDRQWFESLWSQHADRVFAYAARRVGRAEAHDVVADTFVVAWRHRKRRPQRELPWLYGVARRVLRDRYRAEERRARLLERIQGSGGVTASLEDATGDSVDAMSVLSRMEEADRETLLLTAWEGLSAGEAAQVLDITPAAVRMRLTRARRRLQRALTDPASTTISRGDTDAD